MREIPLTQGYVALVEDEDYIPLSKHSWRVRIGTRHRTQYAQTSYRVAGKRFHVQMHRVIMGAKPGQIVDHRDGNGLNNCRANLRITDAVGNNSNVIKRANSSSQYKGVHRMPDGRKKWCASLRHNRTIVLQAYFYTEVEAAQAYDAAVRLHCPDFGRVNFPTPVQQWPLRQTKSIGE